MISQGFVIIWMLQKRHSRGKISGERKKKKLVGKDVGNVERERLRKALDGIRDCLEAGGTDEALKRLEELSEENETGIDFRQVTDHLLDGIYITDRNAITRYVNPAYCKHMGIDPQQVLGRSIEEITREGKLFHKVVSGDVRKLRRNVTSTGVIQNESGRAIPTYVTGVPVFDGDGQVEHVVVSVFDTDSLMYRVTEFRKTVHVEQAIKILDKGNEHEVSVMVGDAPAIREIRRTIARAAPTDVTILITGESGVGKEVIADRIYYASDRQGKPFVKVNCTAIPANLLESELFGYEKGAFTGALNQGKAGLFELANSGTILLDEIGDLPYELQTKLLRVLQQKEVMRLGGTKPISLDVRVIAATNADLKKKMQEGAFREDLYYRLSTIPIYVPPLRERPEDVLKLVKHYFFEYCTKHAHTIPVPDETLAVFQRYSWPGNVRELQNVIEYMVICCEGNVLQPAVLAEYLGVDGEADLKLHPASLKEALDQYERAIILRALEEYGGVRKAAHALDVDPSTISRKARKYGLDLSEQG